MINSVVTFVLFLFLVLPSAAAAPIKLGATIPLSGNLATYGEVIRGGIQLAVEDLRKEGIEVTAIFEDTPLTGPQVISAVRKLVDVDKVNGIVGNFSLPAMVSMASIIQRGKIPTFHTAVSDDLILNSGDWIFSTNVRIREESSALAEYLYNTKGYRRIAIIYVQTNFGEDYAKHFQTRFTELGGKISEVESFEIDSSDYRTQLSRISASSPEAVFAGCFGPFLGITLKQARELGIKVPFFSTYESEDSSVLAAAGTAADGLQYFVTFDASANSNFYKFRSRFIENFHVEPGTFGSNSYDATVLLARALIKCGSEKECTKQTLLGTQSFLGVSGTFSIAPDGKARKQFFLRTVRNGQFTSE